ncbi:MAG TPA: phage portal protein [Anaerohalosphaeraceae bacterium]|nr:phage portal protein [Anaerohalosphaeraceae bacterium]HQI08380.1 phage portal protein [Anaerohalosphaeraceae bacterium]
MSQTLAKELFALYNQHDQYAQQVDVHRKDAGVSLSDYARMWRMGLDLESGASGRPSQPYSQVSWVWKCVTLIQDVCQDVTPVLSTREDRIIEGGPVWDFLFGDPDRPFSDFLKTTLGHLLLKREVYWIWQELDGQTPKGIVVAGADEIEPIRLPDGDLLGYRWTPIGSSRQFVLMPEDLHAVIGFNPTDKLRGAGPLDAGKIAVSSAYQAALFNEATMANGARIGIILALPPGVKLTPEEKELMKAEFRRQQGGAHNAGKAFLATGGVEVKTISQTFAELGMIDLRKFDAAEICSLFGVPSEIVGLATEAQYAHGPAQQRFLLYTISPLLSYIAEHINLGILRRFRFRADGKHKAVQAKESKVYMNFKPLGRNGSYRSGKQKALLTGLDYFLWFDVESHPVIAEMTRARAEQVLKFTQHGIPLEQVVAAFDLPFDVSDMPWAREWWTSMGTVPARWILDGGPESVTGPTYSPEAQEEPKEGELGIKKDNQNQKDKEEKRGRIWKQYVSSWLPIERQFQAALRTFFRRQRRELTNKLQKALAENKGLKSDTSEILARVVLDLVQENGKLKVINRTFFERAARLGASQIIAQGTGQVGAALQDAAEQTLRRQAVRQAMQVSSQKITNVNATTQRAVQRHLREGLQQGEGLRELTDRLERVLDGSRARAMTIARTQTSSAVSAGRYAGLQTSGADRKAWLTAGDERVRDAHRQAEQRYADGIPSEQPFLIGGEPLMYPGDPNGSAAQIVNCRCALLAMWGRKGVDLDWWERAAWITENGLSTDRINEI